MDSNVLDRGIMHLFIHFVEWNLKENVFYFFNFLPNSLLMETKSPAKPLHSKENGDILF